MLEFIADPFYIGSDSFLYTMVDQSGGLSNTGTVTINIIPGSNVPPISS